MWRSCRPYLFISDDYETYEIKEPFHLRFVLVRNYLGNLEFTVPSKYARCEQEEFIVNESFRFVRDGELYRLVSEPESHYVTMMYARSAYSVYGILQKAAEEFFDFSRFLPLPSPRTNDDSKEALYEVAYYVGIPRSEIGDFVNSVTYQRDPDHTVTVTRILRSIADKISPQPAGLRLLSEAGFEIGTNFPYLNMLKLLTFTDEESARIFLDYHRFGWHLPTRAYRVLRDIVPIFPTYCTIADANILSKIFAVMEAKPPDLEDFMLIDYILDRRFLLLHMAKKCL